MNGLTHFEEQQHSQGATLPLFIEESIKKSWSVMGEGMGKTGLQTCHLSVNQGQIFVEELSGVHVGSSRGGVPGVTTPGPGPKGGSCTVFRTQTVAENK